MRFRNNKATEWLIFKLQDGEWECWGDMAKTEKEAKRILKEAFDDKSWFSVVKVEYTKVCTGNDKSED